ncbi:unnamed protein product [Chironomus riparius]|uniref:Uncharacterized protein n=1 Tax=Chironomus riparius TaxID=315576 RepID=A0A9N9S3K6_9DIPT|nr:unnamed protein product [Chironomus riparius]
MAMDGAAFVLIVIYLVFYICLKICCKTDSEEDPAAQVAASSPQNQHPSGPGYIITTSTINAQSYTNNNTNGYAISGTQSNQPFPSDVVDIRWILYRKFALHCGIVSIFLRLIMNDTFIGVLIFVGVYVIYKSCAYVCKKACEKEEQQTSFMSSRVLQPRNSVSDEAENPTQNTQTHIPMPMPYGSQVSLPYPQINSECPYPPLCPYLTQHEHPPPFSHSLQRSQHSEPYNSTDQLDLPPNYAAAIKMHPNLEK